MKRTTTIKASSLWEITSLVADSGLNSPNETRLYVALNAKNMHREPNNLVRISGGGIQRGETKQVGGRMRCLAPSREPSAFALYLAKRMGEEEVGGLCGNANKHVMAQLA